MTETGLIALVGIVGTLLGTIGGAWISRRSTLDQMRTQRFHETQDAARATIVRLIVAGRQWRDSIVGVSIDLAVADSVEESEQLRVTLIPVDPHSSDPVTRGRVELRDALAEAEILSWSDDLDAAIARLGALHPRWWNEVILTNESSIGAGEESVDIRVTRIDEFDDEVLACLADVVHLARTSLSPRSELI